MAINRYTSARSVMAKSRKNVDVVGDGRHKVNWLPKNKLPAFERLFEAVKAHCGNEARTCEFIGIQVSTIWKMRAQKRLSSEMGARILAAYKKLQANGTGTNASADTGSRSQAGI